MQTWSDPEEKKKEKKEDSPNIYIRVHTQDQKQTHKSSWKTICSIYGLTSVYSRFPLALKMYDPWTGTFGFYWTVFLHYLWIQP